MLRPIVLLACVLAGLASLALQTRPDALAEGFRNPPAAARPHLYFMLLNGHVDRAHLEKEIAAYAEAGIGGLCVFDIGARGDAKALPPAGPAFLSPASLGDLAFLIRTAGRHGLEVDLSVSSSWDMGGSWVRPEDASMTLLQSSIEIEGGKAVDVMLPDPILPPESPRTPGGTPAFSREVALLAIPDPQRVEGHEFVFELRPPLPHEINRVVLHNNAVPAKGETPRFARDFTVSVSSTGSRAADFREVVRGRLEARGGPQEFRFPSLTARYVRLHIVGGYSEDRVELAEFEVFSTAGVHVNPHWRALVLEDPAGLVRFTSARGQVGEWAAENIHDGVKQGPRGSWASGSAASLRISDHRRVIDLNSQRDASGRLRWNAPPGRWLLVRFVCVNTGERLKVPSPNSDGLATDHLSAGATRRYLEEVIGRLRTVIPDLRASALRDLYLASYEVRGQIWTPSFLDEFQRRRGYSFTPFLAVLSGGIVDSEDTTERVLFDYRKTLGELLVDAYYRTAASTARAAGLTIESEAGGPGPYLHQVPVDALLAQGAVDSVRGEFWPDRMTYNTIWVVKETASAAHIYGKRLVHMEAFTTNNHWQEAPQDLKLSADRAFAEGMNHVVWHTAAHQPPAAGKPGWVYGAGTHLNQNVTWWPMARPFLTYLARASFLLQQGNPVADVLYYYGDQGYNFVHPKHVDPAKAGAGYEYDVTNADVLLRRMDVRDGSLVLPEGTRYRLLALPDREDIDLAVLRRVEQLVREGATVTGRPPTRSSGYSGFPENDAEVRRISARLWGGCAPQDRKLSRYGKGEVACGLTAREVLTRLGVAPDFRYTGAQDAQLDFAHRSTPEAEIYFVHNKRRRAERVEAEFRVTGHVPELWDAATGERRDALEFGATGTGTKLPLTLDPEGSIFVVFRRAGQPTASPRRPQRPAPLPITGPWRVRFGESR
nr:hypothetical protein [Bryobacter sp.]